ncbi:hypothetical protein THARTR1_10706 [Trichoderma harzianum]|uniref:Uncharacterized protein n=1 Tax=Trichoderma harzianum TaxID=5544 RepID=A0A2K0TM51_TRIHA|nr:hypothetical protein THARTR1_10706 [Trichoderma harzianum]
MHPRRGEVDECLVEIANPDITGLGVRQTTTDSMLLFKLLPSSQVTIALIVPMLMTTISIFWGYFTLSLPEDRYNAVDALFIGLFSRDKALASSREADIRRQARIKALENIILSFADQQLMMGLAISVAIVCVMAGAGDLDGQTSTGALQMACSLAFFSCTTHISSISVVRDHYYRHRKLRNVRFAVGALLVGLICALSIITDSDAFSYDYRLSVKCAIASHEWSQSFGPELFTTIISSVTFTAFLILGLARKMLEVLSSHYRNSKAQFYAAIFGIVKEADALNRFAAIDRYSCVNEVIAMNSRRRHAIGVVADFVFAEMDWALNDF